MEILGTVPGLRATFNWMGWASPWLTLGVVLFAGAATAGAQSGTPVEYRLKAVFLFNFAQFVEWPAEAFPDAGAPLVIGVIGDDPFGPVLDEAVKDEKIGGRPLAIRRFKPADDLTTCHILFISRSEEGHLEQIVARLQGRSILTVSDSDGSAQRGVMIRFFTENRKIRLKINLEAARAARLVLSSKLLRPAEIVTGEYN
jgi:hypothetical protein